MNFSVNEYTIIFIGAILLDLLIGDPVFRFHPVRIIGKTISLFEEILYIRNGWKINFFTGTILSIAVIGIFSGLYILFSYMTVNPLIRIIGNIIIFKCMFAFRDLISHVKKVMISLREDIIVARKNLSNIVGRSTQKLSETQICSASLETLSENFVDSVISPFFYYFIVNMIFRQSAFYFNPGVLFAILYRSVNTMDAMIGYRNEKYEYFGKFSAKLDDILNFIPARLTPVIFSIAVLYSPEKVLRIWKCFFKYRKCHESPNSACGECCIAGILNVVLGGDAHYSFGVRKREKINSCGTEPDVDSVKIGIKVLYICYTVFIIIGIGILYV